MQNATICCAISAVTDPYSSMDDMKNGNTHMQKIRTFMKQQQKKANEKMS